MGTVRTTFTSEDKDVQRSLDNMTKALVKQREELNRLKQASKEAAEEGRRMAQEAKKSTEESINRSEQQILSIGKMALGYMSVQKAIQLVNAELQNKVDLEARSGQAQITAANAQISFLRNLGVTTPQERQQILGGIGKISADSGVTQRDLFLAAASAVSAKGDNSNQAVLDAVRQAARVAPENPSELAATAGGLLDVASLTKTADARQNLGFALGIGSVARIESLKDINENLVPGAIGVSGFGDNASQSAGLVSTLTSLMKDPTGRMSGTAAIQLAAQLEAAFPTADILDDKGKVSAKGTGMTSTTERIEFLQRNPKLAEQFFRGGSFESKAKIPIRDILTGGSVADSLLEDYTAKIPTGEAAGRIADEFVSGVRDEPLQRNADLARKFAQSDEELLISNIVNGQGGISREGLENLLKSTGRGSLFRTMDMLEFDVETAMGKDPLQMTTEIIESQRRRLLNQPGSPEIEQRRRSQLDDVDAGRLRVMERMLDELTEIRYRMVDTNPNREQHN